MSIRRLVAAAAALPLVALACSSEPSTASPETVPSFASSSPDRTASGGTRGRVISDLVPGESGVLAVGTHCGVAVLGRFVNGYVWRTSEAEGIDWVPHEWYSGPVPPDPIDIAVSLSDDGTVLTAELHGREVTYVQDGQEFAEADQCA